LRAASASDRANRENDQNKKETKLHGRLCSVAHRNSSFGELHLRPLPAVAMLSAFTSSLRHSRLKTRRCRHANRLAMHQSMCRSLTSTDVAENQCKLSYFLICVVKKPKFPEEKNCEEYCSVSEIFCKIVARVK
jgi:hypothetical protein